MSRTIDFFFQASLSIGEFPEWALQNLGLVFKTREGSHFYGSRYLQSCLFLQQNRSKEIEDYDIEHLNFRLDLDPTSGDTKRKLAAFTVLSCTIMSSPQIGHDGLLLFDGQCPLAKYARRGGKLVDELSGVDVTFPQHLTDVFKAWYRAYPEYQDKRS